MLDAIGKIRRFTAGTDRPAFLANELVQSAVLMQLVVIGELSKKVSDERKTGVDLPWKQISGFRDRVVHDYYEVDLEYVWLTVQNDIPDLERALTVSL